MIIYFIVKIIIQQRKWASIKNSQTEPLFLSDLEWDSSGKIIYVGYKNPLTLPSSTSHIKLPPYKPQEGYTYSFWLFMNGNNPFYPGAKDAKGAANISDNAFAGKINNIFYRGSGEYKLGKTKMCPSVLFGGNEGNTFFLAFTYGTKQGTLIEQIAIDDFKVNEWVNVTVTVLGRVINIFYNGQLERSVQLVNTPDTPGNGYNIYVGSVDDGFPGEMAYLQYYRGVLQTGRIEDIYQYYKKKIDAFMTNVNYWVLNGKVVPSVPTDLHCIPVTGDGDGDGDGDGTGGSSGSGGGFMASLEGKFDDFKSKATAEASKLDSKVKGSASNGSGSGIFGDLQGDYSNMKSDISSHTDSKSSDGKANDAVTKLEQW